MHSPLASRQVQLSHKSLCDEAGQGPAGLVHWMVDVWQRFHRPLCDHGVKPAVVLADYPSKQTRASGSPGRTATSRQPSAQSHRA